jgi:hypothetical protein
MGIRLEWAAAFEEGFIASGIIEQHFYRCGWAVSFAG